MKRSFSHLFSVAIVAGLVVFGAGCKKKNLLADGGVASGDGGKSSGLGAADNDAKTVTLTKAALACPKGSSGYLFDTDCAAYKAFRDAKLLSGPVDATLINMLEDEDPRVRYLAALTLDDSKAVYRTDKAMATRVIAAANAETSESVARSMGDIIGRIDVEKTGLLDPIVAMVKKHPLVPLRRAIVSHILFTNNRNRPTFDFMVGMADDPDKDMRREAISAFWIGGGLSNSETCKVFEKHVFDSEPDVAAKSSELLGMYHHCVASYDVLLAAVDKAKDGAAKKESGFAYGIQKMCEDEAAKPAHKSKGAALAKGLTATGNQVFVRKYALRGVMACDPAGGKAFVAKFTKDKEKWIAEEAVELLKPKKK
ncbi:MAG: hypothetical protein U0174_20670 [Polyangiaceae bacterium]